MAAPAPATPPAASAPRPRECQRCQAPASSPCAGCGAFFFCSAACAAAHATDAHPPEQCARVAAQMARGPELAAFPFAFSREATADADAGRATECTFLAARGLHGAGVWRRECPCAAGALSGGLPPAEDPPGSLPESGTHGTVTVQCTSFPESWAALYAARGLPLAHPAALALSGPLTVLRCLDGLVRSGELPLHARATPVRIHLLGPEGELDASRAFREVLVWYPGLEFEITFVGPAVPESTAASPPEISRAAHGGSLTVTALRGLYHTVAPRLPRPDLVVGLNAGLAAYPTWLPTLRHLARPGGPPSFFTDYAEEAAVLACRVLAAAGAAVTRPVAVNPFRRPFSSQGRDNALPSYSNAFVFGIN